MICRTQALILLLGANGCFVRAWIAQHRLGTHHAGRISVRATKDAWSVADDWSSFSSDSQENSGFDSATLFNQDLAVNAARDIESANGTATMNEEDLWINDVVDEIHNSFSTLDGPQLYDTSFDEEENGTLQSMDDAGNEVAMLVRCNEVPEDLLISEGRLLAPLAEEEKNNPNQLVILTKDECKATEFLRESVSKMFHQHASTDKIDGLLGMDRAGVAEWMTQSLRSEKAGRVSAHDKRVLITISDYSSHGSGRIFEEGLQELYLSTIVGDTSKLSTVSPARQLQLRRPFIDVVWRDIRNHNILSPVEQERQKLADEIAKNGGGAKSGSTDETIMDECEILDWDYRPEASTNTWEKTEASGIKNSHKKVELASDKKTPVRVRDGELGTSL
jgi:hypothetical protein